LRTTLAGSEVFIGTGSRTFDSTLPSVVFLHGAGMDHTVWVMAARHFARKGFSVVAPDLPGHGRSGGQPLTSVNAMADWLGELLALLRVSETRVVGHSMGALVAYALCSRQPGLCGHLVLLGISHPMPVAAAMLAAAQDDHPAAFEMANTWSHSQRGKLGGNETPGIWMFSAGQRLMERTRPGVFHADLAACNTYEPASVQTIDCPVMVIAGSADQMTPLARGRSVVADLEQAQCRVELVKLPGTGHAMLSECPNAVLDSLIRALI
jgi:pimeloyl-ACP methyl ester carboxylesterase